MFKLDLEVLGSWHCCKHPRRPDLKVYKTSEGLADATSIIWKLGRSNQRIWSPQDNMCLTYVTKKLGNTALLSVVAWWPAARSNIPTRTILLACSLPMFVRLESLLTFLKLLHQSLIYTIVFRFKMEYIRKIWVLASMFYSHARFRFSSTVNSQFWTYLQTLLDEYC